MTQGRWPPGTAPARRTDSPTRSERGLTGELWSFELGTPVDPEAGLRHPALVVSARRMTGPLRMVCPLTTTRGDYPWRTEIEADEGNGLHHTSYVQAEHLRSISTARGVHRLGAVDPLTLVQVRRVLALLLELS